MDGELNIKPSDRRDLIGAIEKISLEIRYRDVIKAVGSMPFFVFYYVRDQLMAYIQFIKKFPTTAQISIGATGSLVQKFKKCSSLTQSGHIFLYAVVINMAGCTIPVYQMLSEKHENEFIEYYIH